MVQRLLLSLSEAQFLFTQGDQSTPNLGPLDIERPEQSLVRAGLSSLVARGLAMPVRDGLMLTPDLRGAAAVLLRPRVWVGAVRVQDDGMAVLLFGAPDEGPSSLITLAGLGCLEVSVLAGSMGAPVEAFGRLVALMLDAPDTRAEVRAPISGDIAELTLGHRSPEGWFIQEGQDESPSSREQVMSSASELLQRALDAA
jgi:hypothetical protein